MPHLTLKLIPHTPSSRRVVCVIPKTVVKKAVRRNLIKRRIRAIVVPLLVGASHDCVVIARKGIDAITFQELQRELGAAMDHPHKK